MLGHPSDQRKGWRRPSPSRGHAGEASQPRDPSFEDDLDVMVNQMLESTRQRREAKRTGLQNHHRARQVDTKNKINNTFDDHEESALQRRKTQIARLIEVLKRKDDIERRIATGAKVLERAYLLRSSELRAALDGRVAELR